MKNFDQWFRDFRLPEPEKPLPEGIDEHADGTYWARCCCCGKLDEIPCDISEIPMEGYEHFCGGSPRCCP